ncbi:MAG: hypothetical protein BWY68_00057 [bacterium ADurb.Bin400]|nr:MAG: hypothetical protein BWY68_00057 [bacterium ADurb.Bin400]
MAIGTIGTEKPIKPMRVLTRRGTVLFCSNEPDFLMNLVVQSVVEKVLGWHLRQEKAELRKAMEAAIYTRCSVVIIGLVRDVDSVIGALMYLRLMEEDADLDPIPVVVASMYPIPELTTEKLLLAGAGQVVGCVVGLDGMYHALKNATDEQTKE